jgi:hypothetical protein
MLRDPEEVFRFIWENRDALGVDERSYTQVVSVRPSLRIGPEGFLLRETICEYVSRANIFGAELKVVCNVDPRPPGVNSNTALTVYGAGTLVFDQYGQLKYHIARQMSDGQWQRKRLEYLVGEPMEEPEIGSAFANLHRMRANCASCDDTGKRQRSSSSPRAKRAQAVSLPTKGHLGGSA